MLKPKKKFQEIISIKLCSTTVNDGKPYNVGLGETNNCNSIEVRVTKAGGWTIPGSPAPFSTPGWLGEELVENHGRVRMRRPPEQP